jgi:hypothetical protein
MEVRSTGSFYKTLVRVACSLFIVMAVTLAVAAQDLLPRYTVQNGRMVIELNKQLRQTMLDSFIVQYELDNLYLNDLLRSNKRDSLLKQGWQIDLNNADQLVISKPLFAGYDMQNLVDRILHTDKSAPLASRFPAVNNGIRYGYNRFRNKFPFAVKDSIVCFYLRNNNKASRVMLAGSFNNWDPRALSMTRTDSGWIASVKLRPGKYWYKFIVDGNWIVDPDNLQRENDGQGNVNSVFFCNNKVFALAGFQAEKKVFVSGSFNNWRPNELEMTKTASGWELPLYLAEGTHTYKFIVDGRWLADEKNRDQLPDGHGAYNSVWRIGRPHLFRLDGFAGAQKVVLCGSFNGWREDELFLTKTPGGWELPYVLGPGNYEYKFRVDGKWISDPENTQSAGENSFLVIQPNYTFRLAKFADAKSVYIAGDFNNWKPRQLAMKKEGDEWVFPLHLFAGKVRYKFIVDGNWILDPANKQWEQNEYKTGNSVLWVEQ